MATLNSKRQQYNVYYYCTISVSELITKMWPCLTKGSYCTKNFERILVYKQLLCSHLKQEVWYIGSTLIVLHNTSIHRVPVQDVCMATIHMQAFV